MRRGYQAGKDTGTATPMAQPVRIPTALGLSRTSVSPCTERQSFQTSPSRLRGTPLRTFWTDNFAPRSAIWSPNAPRGRRPAAEIPAQIDHLGLVPDFGESSWNPSCGPARLRAAARSWPRFWFLLSLVQRAWTRTTARRSRSPAITRTRSELPTPRAPAGSPASWSRTDRSLDQARCWSWCPASSSPSTAEPGRPTSTSCAGSTSITVPISSPRWTACRSTSGRTLTGRATRTSTSSSPSWSSASTTSRDPTSPRRATSPPPAPRTSTTPGRYRKTS